MASTPDLSTSQRFLLPLQTALEKCKSPRVCPVLSDYDWLTLGVTRVASEATSGRGFLQDAIGRGENVPSYGLFFEALKSQRRLKLCQEVNEHVCSKIRRKLPDALSEFSELDSFEIRAGDGHWHGAASHDPSRKKQQRCFYQISSRSPLHSLFAHSSHAPLDDE